MTEILESTLLLSANEANDDDDEQTMLRDVINFKDVSTNPGTVLDKPPSHYQTAAHGVYPQGPSQNPQSGGSQSQLVVTNQPTTGDVQQQVIVRESYYSTNVKVCLGILFVWSCLTFLTCWPLAITSCCLTGYAMRSASRGEDPKALMIGAIIAIVPSIFVGIPLTFVTVVLIVGGELANDS